MRFKLPFILLSAAILLLSIPLILHKTSNGELINPGNTSAEHALRQMTTCFTTNATISYNGQVAKASISQTSPESCKVEFLSPDTLKDMVFNFNNDSVDVTYKGLSFGFDPAAIPGTSVAKTIVASINDALVNKDLEVEKLQNALALLGEFNGSKFYLMLDPENGKLLKLSVPDRKLEIEFENFTFLQ